MWSFNRLRDSSQIKTKEIIWQGPFSWPGFEIYNVFESIPDVEGVYILTFKFEDGYLLYSVGITNSTKRRIAAHTREYKKGNYTVLDIKSAESGERREIWHGWQYAKTHQDEFIANKESILAAVNKQLTAFKVFVAEVPDKREKERIEAAIMHNIYVSKEPWSELADRGMYLRERYNSEIPIEIKSISSVKLYGLPELLEI